MNSFPRRVLGEVGSVGDLPFQPELFGVAPLRFDARFARLRRLHLDAESWIDWAEGWGQGADALFEQILVSQRGGQRARWIHDQERVEPRLPALWTLKSNTPLEPPLLEAIRG